MDATWYRAEFNLTSRWHVRKKMTRRIKMFQLAAGVLVVVLMWTVITSRSTLSRCMACALGTVLYITYKNNPSLRSADISADISAAIAAMRSSTKGLPQTRNPQYISPSEPQPQDQPQPQEQEHAPPQEQPQPQEHAQPPAAHTPIAYTQTAMQALLDERAFRPDTNLNHSYASRERVLNGMYQELLDTSSKQDPALQSGTKEPCQPIRGSVKARPV